MHRASLAPACAGRKTLVALLLFAAGIPSPRAAAFTSTPPSREAAASPSQAQRDVDKLDINTASVDQLMALPGMGRAYADRIIKGRPYRAKNQLTQKGILPNAAYARIKDKIVARQPSK